MAETVAQTNARRQREREAFEAEEERARRGELTYIQRRAGGLTGKLWEGALQGDTALRSAANAFMLGGANSLAAGLDALPPVGGQGIRERYDTNLAAERARDQYDALHRPLARQVGAGAATAIALFGGPRLPAARRLTSVARSGRDTAAVLGAGGASGLAVQSLADAMAHRPSDWRDNIGAIAGGVAGSAAMIPFGPGSGAAVGAATTTAVRNAMHGGSTSLEDLGRSAAAGRAIGAVAALGGRQLSQNLSMQAKGRLGESLGAVRSAINRMEREPGPKRLFKPDPAKPGTFADGQSGDILFEDKFGPKAALSAGQRLAQKILGPNYIVYHWHPEDVGKIVALPFTGLAPQLLNWRPAVRHPQSPPARR